jgi:hypothetical protein
MSKIKSWAKLAFVAGTPLLLALVAPEPSSAQGGTASVELFKIIYGKAQGQLVVIPEKFPPVSNGSEANEREPELTASSAWPGSFCVSWDGQMFFFDDSARMLLPNSETESGRSQIGTGTPPNPYVQVYDRQGQWVRAIEIVRGDPGRMRVGADGKLYVQGNDGAEVYNPDGTYNKTLSERIQAVVRNAYASHNLYPGSALLWEVDHTGRCFFLTQRIIEHELLDDGKKKVTTMSDRLLVVSPNGTVNVLPVVTYDPFAVNRYTGQVLVADYSASSLPQEDRRGWTLYDERERRVFDDSVFDVVPELTFRWFTVEGGIVRSIQWQLDVSRYLPNVWDAYNGARNWRFQIPILFDQQGHIYKIYTRQQQRQRYLYTDANQTEGTTLINGFWIVEFDAQGQYVRSCARDIALEVGIDSRTLWDVDRDGNVYWVEFQADHLRVMMSPKQ